MDRFRGQRAWRSRRPRQPPRRHAGPGSVLIRTKAAQEAAEADQEADQGRRIEESRKLHKQAISLEAARELVSKPDEIAPGGTPGQRIHERAARQRLAAVATKALQYLSTRHLVRLAEKTPARILLRPGFDDKPWQILWPLAPLGGKLDGISLDAGRGGDNKRVNGRKQRRFFACSSAKPQLAGQRVVAFFEGAATGGAIDHIAEQKFGLICMVDAGNLAELPRDLILKFPEIADRAIICGDNDTIKKNGKRPGNDAAFSAAWRIREVLGADFPVEIALPPQEDTDWADVLDGCGVEAAREIFQTARQPASARPDNRPRGADILPIQFWQGEPQRLALNLGIGSSLAWAETQTREGVKFALSRSILENLKGPTLFQVSTGVGKTTAMVSALAVRAAQKAPLPSIFLTPLVAGAAEAYQKFLEQNPHQHSGKTKAAHLHQPRSTDNCFKFDEIRKLSQAHRSPHAHACMTCPHGQRGPDQCGYIQGIGEARNSAVVFATHAAAGEESSLFSYFGDMEKDDEPRQRQIIIDERMPQNSQIEVTLTDIKAVEWMMAPVEADLPAREEAAIKAAPADGRDRIKKDFILLKKWLYEIRPCLARLAADLASSPAGRQTKIDGPEWERFAKKVANPPPLAMLKDATLLEDVRAAWAAHRDTPIAWILGLGRAIRNNTAWIEDGVIRGGYPSELWQKFLGRNGVNLDATPSLRTITEIKQKKGVILPAQAAQNFEIVQHGPQLFGRDKLDDIKKLASRAERLITLIDEAKADGEQVCALTFKPIAAAVHAIRPDLEKTVGWWGKHERQHNDWSGYTRQIIFGLPILPPDHQAREYAMDAAACGWPAWDGAVERQATVEIAPGVSVISAAPLPTLPEARAWFLDRLGADVAQAAGRLRACRATRAVRVDIFGAVPIIGHGLEITGFEIAAGAARTRGDKVQAVAAAIASLPETAERTQRAIVAECERHGFRPDRRLVARVLAQARIEVEQSGHTLIAAAAALCQRA